MPFRRILYARYVFTAVGEPIENGFVAVEGGRIAEVGKSLPLSGEHIELGNVAILPGLVNAHTHLEFSGLSQPLGTPGMGFVDWIREVIAWRQCHLLESEHGHRLGHARMHPTGNNRVGQYLSMGRIRERLHRFGNRWHSVHRIHCP